MIASITGKISAKTSNSLIIDVQGIGFEVFVSNAVANDGAIGQQISLLTHLIVREDLLSLYGFSSSEEKNIFTLLLGVDGVGPRLALAVLSNLSMDNIKGAVLNEQPEFFSRVPGIGKKTAQKILIHLQGKFDHAIGESLKLTTSSDESVFDALVSLGYSVVEAQSAIQAIPKDTPDEVEEKLRVALRYFNM